MATTIADFLEEAAPVLVKQAQEAEARELERQRQADIEEGRRRARQRVEARQRARQAANEELRSIVKAWNDAFALEAFFGEVSRSAAVLEGDDRAELEGRIAAARDLMGGRDAVERFLQWTLPSAEMPDGADDDDES